MNNVKVRLNKKGVGKLLKSKELADGEPPCLCGPEPPGRRVRSGVLHRTHPCPVAEVRAESYAARKENADTNSILKALK